jgi:hypothetical protein
LDVPHVVLTIVVAMAVGEALTVIVIPEDVAGDPVRHGVASEVITTVTTSPLTRADDMNDGLFVPVLTPFILHWYAGVVPPFVGVAVNVTDVPSHIAPAGEAAMLTLAGRLGLTAIVIPEDVAGDPVTHGVAFEVITTVTTSPLTSAADANDGLFVPVFTPFTLH